MKAATYEFNRPNVSFQTRVNITMSGEFDVFSVLDLARIVINPDTNLDGNSRESFPIFYRLTYI